MGRPNVGSAEHMPLRIIPEAIKLPEDAVQAADGEGGGSFQG
jgi:hypothetical protein